LRNQYYAFALAEWTWATGNHTLAWERYEKIIRDPMAGETLIQTIGTLLEQRGALAEAERCFETAARQATWTVQPLLAAARVAEARGAPQRAVRYLEVARAREPDHVGVRKNLGASYLELREFGKAVEVTREALRLRPDDYQLHANLGAIYHAMGDLERAREAWRQALRLNPGDPQLRAWMERVGGSAP